MDLKTSDNFHIPVVDLSCLNDISSDWDELKKVELDQLVQSFGKALRSSGLILLENHGVSDELIEKAFAESVKFFRQDASVKDRYAKFDYANFTCHDGYAKIEMESPSNASEPKEFFNFRNFFQTNIEKNDDIGVPDDDIIFDFKKTFVTLEQQCSQLFIKLLRLLSLSLGMDDIDFFANKAKSLVDKGVDSYNVIRTLYYPPLPEQEKHTGLRFSEHTDWGVFTILFRDAVNGLEVRTNAGNWIPTDHKRESIVLFVGDLLELLTGGYYKAAVHRVQKPKNKDEQSASRQSIAYFLNLDADVTVEPLSDGICRKSCESMRTGQFKPFSIKQFIERKSEEVHDGKWKSLFK